MDFCKLAGDIRLYVELSRLEKLAQQPPELLSAFQNYLKSQPAAIRQAVLSNPTAIQNSYSRFKSTFTLPGTNLNQVQQAVHTPGIMGQTGQSGRQLLAPAAPATPARPAVAPRPPMMPHPTPNMFNSGQPFFGSPAAARAVSNIKQMDLLRGSANAGVGMKAFSMLRRFAR